MKVFLAFRDCVTRDMATKAAILEGINALGWETTKIKEECDFGIWWGIPTAYFPLIEWFSANNKPYLVVDFPFWGRTNRHNIFNGYYKFSLNGVNPTEYLTQGHGGPDRARLTGAPQVRPYIKDGDYILLAGMGPKACDMFKIDRYSWDNDAADLMRANTERPIIYRQKPSDKFPQQITYTQFDDGQKDIRLLYERAYAVVTHHGNSTLEALSYGKPGFTKHSITKHMGHTDLTMIDTPMYPDGREEFLQQVAWWQWHFREIRKGLPFRHFADRGLLAKV